MKEKVKCKTTVTGDSRTFESLSKFRAENKDIGIRDIVARSRFRDMGIHSCKVQGTCHE